MRTFIVEGHGAITRRPTISGMNMSNTPTTQPSTGAVGLTVFAAAMMIMVGLFQAIAGVVALFNDAFYIVGEKYVFQFDVTTWGWIHLILGIVIAAAGFFLFRGAVWARTVGGHPGQPQRPGELRLAALLPLVGDRHHRPGRVRHLGPDRPRPRHHAELSPSPANPRGTRAAASPG